jgi:uncharacterized membrane protein
MPGLGDISTDRSERYRRNPEQDARVLKIYQELQEKERVEKKKKKKARTIALFIGIPLFIIICGVLFYLYKKDPKVFCVNAMTIGKCLLIFLGFAAFILFVLHFGEEWESGFGRSYKK